jgi:hypothetical protein
MSSYSTDSDQAEDAAIRFIGVHKWYGHFHVLRNINLTVGRAEHRGLWSVWLREVDANPVRQSA